MRPALTKNNGNTLPPRSLLAIALILSWILCLYCTGLYFFSKGFLLTRLRLPNTSECHVLPSLTPLSENSTAPQSNACWYPARYKKAVFIVIDALRFDFTVYNTTLAETTEPIGDGNDSPVKIPYYLNRLKTIHSKVNEEPENALLFQIIADPPTTTLQRLKGITTGSLPTFVEAGNNFGGSAIGEDNIIDQLASIGRRVAFMGDDTWVALFPTAFKESLKFPSESLIVWDLHTVDNEVIEHLFPLLDESRKDEWDVIVGHFLGVDHCGHRFGPNHVTMGDKLTQMDSTISQILDRVDDDTLVIVMGDHGMDSKGDHGGESPQEKEAAMFLYSKKALVGPSALQLKGFQSQANFKESASIGGQGFLAKFLSRVDSEAEWESFTDQLGGHRTIPQIDVLPTLSLLLGVPIPFNNLGTIIPELFYHPSPSSDDSQSEIELLLRALQLNARQVHRYMFEYTRTQPSTELAMVNEKHLGELFKKAEAAAIQLDEKSPSGSRLKIAEDAAAAYAVYLRSSLRMCRQIWAQFDTPLMGLGLGFLLVTNAVAIVHLRRVRRRIALSSFADSDDTPECKSPNGRSGIAVSCGGVLGALISCPMGFREQYGFSMVEWYVLGSAVGSVVAYALGWKKAVNKTDRNTRSWSRTDVAVGLCLLLPQLFFSASNSTLINEDSITAFLLQSFAVFHLLKAGAARVARTRNRLIAYALVFLVLTRFNRHLTICREEQFAYCIPTFYASETSSVPSHLSIALVAVLGIVGPWYLSKVLKDSESFHGVAVIWINALRISFAFSIGYWLLDMEENMEYRNVKMNTARIAAAFVVLFGVPVWWRHPECLKAESVEVSAVAEMVDGKAPISANGEHKRKMVILGTGNILGAPYLVFMAMLFALLMIVQQPSGILALAAELGQTVAAWEIFDYSRDVEYEGKNLELPPYTIVPSQVPANSVSSNRQTQPQPQLLPQPTTHRNVTLIQPLILILIANQAFFATGHQRTLSAIQWNSGFIGLHETSFVISPILVGLNTFGAYIIAGCAVPVLALWKLSPQDFFMSSPVRQRAAGEQILQAGLMFLLITFGASTTAASFWTAWFRRHLMVWKIFAPTWMFLVASSAVSAVSMIAIGLGIGTARTIQAMSGLCGWSR